LPKKVYQVLEEYNPKKHNVSLRPSQRKCFELLKKGDIFEPKIMIVDNAEYFATASCKDHLNASKHAVFSTLRIARSLGIIKEVDTGVISFNDFCQLESLKYFSEQLRGTKNKYLKVTKTDGSTKKNYLYRCWEFNNWLHGKTFEFKQTKHLTETTFETITEKITVDGLEHLLDLYKKSFNSDSDFIRVIKRFLNDEVNRKCSAGYMKFKRVAILAYFEKNECDLRFKYDPHINHHDYSEESSNATLSLDDLLNMLTTGRGSLLDKVVVLCKFHRGLDNSTFVDRFNFQVWDQLVEYFGSEQYENWDISKCPVPIRLTRIKTNYTHVGYLDIDAIQAVQKYLKVRYEKTGRVMKSREALFLGRFNQPLNITWLTKLIPRLAKNAGIQKKLNNSELISRNEKTSHELRDLLKSTLIVNDVASYVCELAIGHKVGDSYEKQDKLYPNKSRLEYMKASKQINIFSNITNNMQENSEIALFKKRNEELETKLAKFEDIESRFNTRMDQVEKGFDLKILENTNLAEKYTKENQEFSGKLAKKNGIVELDVTTDQAIAMHNNIVEKKKQ